MRRLWWVLPALLWMVSVGISSAAPATAAKTAQSLSSVEAGRFKSEDQRCQECHGSDGNGERPERTYPKLAGQFPEYMVKQLQNYRDGERKNDFMTIIARNMEPADMADIAAYYAGQSRMHGKGDVNVDVSTANIGKKLFVNGDVTRNILPCASCHTAAAGADTARIDGIRYPVLAGQDKQYLESEIFSWRSGERHNSPGGVMNNIANALRDDEVQALASYISGLQ